MKKLKLFLVLSLMLFVSSVSFSQGNKGYFEIAEGETLTKDGENFSGYEELDNEDCIFLNSGELTIKNSQISNNSIRAIISTEESKTIIGDGVVFNSNNVIVSTTTTIVSAGAIYNEGDITIGNNVIFSSNSANYGGAIDNSSTLTIQDGAKFNYNVATSSGGAIYNNGTITIGDNAVFNSNDADYGGSIYNSSGTIIVGKNVIFSSHTTVNGGAIYNSTGTITVQEGSKFSNNIAGNGGAIYNEDILNIGKNITFDSNNGQFGGAIYNSDTVTIQEGTKFITNKAGYYGGAIYNTNKSIVTISDNVIFSSNTATGMVGKGGAIFNCGTLTIGNNAIFDSNASKLGGAICTDTNSTTTIGKNVTFSSNTATTGSGGAIYNNGTLTIQEGAQFNYNVATSSGGAIYNDGSLTIVNNSIFDSNSSWLGGAIYTNKELTIQDGVSFIKNKSNDFGGAIYNNSYGITTIGDNVSFRANIADRDGGAIRNEYITTIGNNVNFVSNTTDVDGGAIHNAGTLTIQDGAKFISNTANDQGGAIYNSSTTLTIGNNSVFERNNSTNEGGAIYNDIYCTLTMAGDQNSAFLSNTASGYGGAIYNYGILTVQDGVEFRNNTSTKGGAIFNANSAVLNLIAKTKNIEFSGNKANGVSSAIYDYRGTINLWASDSADIIFNDRIESSNNSSVLNINKSTTTLSATGKVVLNEDMSGFKGITNLYAGTIELGQNGQWLGGNLLVDNATINLANSVIQDYNFHGLTINDTLNLKVDADLQAETMDTITADSYTNGKKINVKAVNITEDTNKKEKISLEFIKNNNMKQDVTTVTTAYSDVYKYNISYDKTTGNMNFLQNGANPIVQESAVSSMGSYVSQLAVANQAFASIDSRVNQVRQPVPEINNKTNTKQNNKNTNKKKASNQYTPLYASTTNQIFESDTKGDIERGLWLRPYVVSDTLDLGAISSVDNTMYGTLAGYDMPMESDKLLSFYIGYTGGNQKYEGIKVNQTAYVLGATGMLIKEKWYIGATINVGMNKSTADNDFGSDDIDKTTYSVGVKGGYDFDLGSNWVLQPNMILMYLGTTSSDFTNVQGNKVKDNGISGILVQPQVKASWKLAKGWTPYGLLDVAINTSESKPEVNGEKLEAMKLDPYFEYGVGVNKVFIGSAWSCYGEVSGKSGSRSGVGFNCGVKYAF